MAYYASHSRPRRTHLESSHIKSPDKPIVNDYALATMHIGHAAQHREPPAILSPKFALSIVVNWPSRIAVDGESIKAKANELRQGGLTISPKNVYGLEGGAIFCFWQSSKDALGSNMRAFLSREPTLEKMRELNVLSITFHDRCRVLLSPKPFQSSVLNRGKTTSFSFGKSGAAGDSAGTLRSQMPDRMGLSGWADQADLGRKDLDNVHQPSPRLHPSSGITVSPTDRNNTQDCSADKRICLPQPSSSLESPSQIPSPDEAILLSLSSVSSGLHSHIAPSAALQKRPRDLLDIDENDVNAKRVKEERHLSRSSPRPSNLTNPRAESALRALDEESVRVALQKERDDYQLEKIRMNQLHAEMKLDLERAKEAEEATRKKNEELNEYVNELVQQLQGFKNEYETAKRYNLQLQATLDDVESSNQVLKNSLQTAQEDCQGSRKREENLQEALRNALRDLEEAHRHTGDAERNLAEGELHAEEAQRKADEERKDALQKLQIAEETLASEQLRRRAAEETFLDVKCILSGVDIFSKTPT